MQPVVSRAGDRALLIDLGGDVSAAQLHAAAASAHGWAGVVGCVVGHQSLYVVFENELAVHSWPLAVNPLPTVNRQLRTVTVSFADEYALDLPAFLAHAGLTRDELLARLPSVQLTARYLGFHAGFAYLEGWPWSMPRRERSRNLVPGGSFGIAGAMAGFYPIDSPGGWNILGRTAEPLAHAISPGDEIRIMSTMDGLKPVLHGANETDKCRTGFSPSSEPIADVLFPGQFTTVVGLRDWSRAEHGISPGGAFDEEMAAATGDGPWLECVLVAPKLRFRVPRRVGWWGGERVMQPGEIFDLGRLPMFRGYIAIEGGVAEPMSKALYAAEQPIQRRETTRPGDHETKVLRIITGPHDAPPLPEEWEVTNELNRVGIRMRATNSERQTTNAMLPSLGMQFGTLQWHPDGTLVIMGPDHPVTGGYLQPATVVSADLWKIAQLAPGDRVRLVAG
jgi:KipI family sensor histidine kinase inhibitor